MRLRLCPRASRLVCENFGQCYLGRREEFGREKCLLPAGFWHRHSPATVDLWLARQSLWRYLSTTGVNEQCHCQHATSLITESLIVEVITMSWQGPALANAFPEEAATQAPTSNLHATVRLWMIATSYQILHSCNISVASADMACGQTSTYNLSKPYWRWLAQLRHHTVIHDQTHCPNLLYGFWETENRASWQR